MLDMVRLLVARTRLWQCGQGMLITLMLWLPLNGIQRPASAGDLLRAFAHRCFDEPLERLVGSLKPLLHTNGLDHCQFVVVKLGLFQMHFRLLKSCLLLSWIRRRRGIRLRLYLTRGLRRPDARQAGAGSSRQLRPGSGRAIRRGRARSRQDAALRDVGERVSGLDTWRYSPVQAVIDSCFFSYAAKPSNIMTSMKDARVRRSSLAKRSTLASTSGLSRIVVGR